MTRPALGRIFDRDRYVPTDPVRALRVGTPPNCLEGRRNSHQRSDRHLPRIVIATATGALKDLEAKGSSVFVRQASSRELHAPPFGFILLTKHGPVI
jgi:hypothetical protein